MKKEIKKLSGRKIAHMSKKERNFRCLELLYAFWYNIREMEVLANNINNKKGVISNDIIGESLDEKNILIVKEIYALTLDAEKVKEELKFNEPAQNKLDALPTIYRLTDNSRKRKWWVNINGLSLPIKREMHEFIEFVYNRKQYEHNRYLFNIKDALLHFQQEYNVPLSYNEMDDIFHTQAYKRIQSLLFDTYVKRDGYYRLKIDYFL
tara:strand:- start:1108 stop:1731 length:624 start_codon:yes stop_codon:yes gene_type:complete